MRGATSPRLLLELMCAQVLLPAAAADERSLLARIERLESGVAGAGRRRHAVTSIRNGFGLLPSPPRLPSGGAAPSVPPAPAVTQESRPAGAAGVAAAAPAGPPPRPPRGPTRSPSSGRRRAPPPAAEPAQRRARRAPGPAAPSRAPRSRTRLAHPEPRSPGARGAARRRGDRRGAQAGVAERGRGDQGQGPGRRRIVIGNASVASFDEGVLTLRFPRQGDVKGFQGSKYEDLLKQALTAMFGINVVVRAHRRAVTPRPRAAGRDRGPPRRPGSPAARRPVAGPGPGAVGPAVAGPAGTGPAGGQPDAGASAAAAPPEDPAARLAAPGGGTSTGRGAPSPTAGRRGPGGER